MKYFFIILSLAYFVYFAPALALAPRLVMRPLTFVVVPLLSSMVIYAIVTLCIAGNFFMPNVILGLTWLIGCIAAFRVQKVLTNEQLHWQANDLKALLLLGLVVLPYFFKLGLYGFDRGDEIYSWNFWALQYVFQEPIDFSHTGAAYPQLLPKLIAYCYHFLGETQWQLPIKGCLILFTYSLIASIYFSVRHTRTIQTAFWLVLLYTFFAAGLERFFKDAYADPLMSGFLIASIVCVYHGLRGKNQQLILLSVLLAIGSFLSKQPGLIWALFGLPCLLMLKNFVTHKKATAFYLVLLFSAGIGWMLTEGSAFYHNQGVVALSFEGRSIWQQLPYAIYTYFIKQPALLLLFVVAGVLAWKNSITRIILFTFFIPSLFFWLMLGAYQLRLGQHLMSLSMLFVLLHFSAQTIDLRQFGRISARLWINRSQLTKLMACCSILGSIYIGAKSLAIEKPGVSVYAGAKHSIYRNFGNDSEIIYAKVYQPLEKTVWVPSRYLYGLFYKHAKLIVPEYGVIKYDKYKLLKQLYATEPDFIFTVGDEVVDGVANHFMRQIVAECPNSFTRVNYAQNRFDFIAYQVDKQILSTDLCLRNIG